MVPPAHSGAGIPGRLFSFSWTNCGFGGEFVRHSEPPFGLPQQHHARIRRDAPAVESGGNLLAANGWKREWEKDIFNHGGCGFDAMA